MRSHHGDPIKGFFGIHLTPIIVACLPGFQNRYLHGPALVIFSDHWVIGDSMYPAIEQVSV